MGAVTAIKKGFAVLALAFVLLGGAGHRHHDASSTTDAPQCAACVLGQAAGVPPVEILPAAAPPVTFVAAAVPAPAHAPVAPVLSFAPKTSPPAASI